MDVTADVERRPGQPRSERDAAFLKRFEAWMQVPIIVSAILPLIVAPETNGWLGIVIGVVTWLVFLVDYVVHARRLEHYGRTGLGRFDLFVVVATAPWFLLPGAQAGRFVVLLRLARLARLVMASRGARRLFDRLGRVAAVAAGVLVTGSLVAYYAEHPTNPEFATVGDALWWGTVTLTTVGYGDIVPKTTTGRLAAITIMITGIAVLGVLAGALASFFRLDGGGNGGSPAENPTSATAPAPVTALATDTATATDAPIATDAATATANDTALAALTAEVSALRRQVEVLTERLTGAPPGLTPEQHPSGRHAAAAP